MSDNKEIEKLRKEIQDLKSEYPLRISKTQIRFALLVLFTYVTYSLAANISSLNTFISGQVISASGMNDNFDYLEEKINYNGRLVAVLKKSSDELISVGASDADFAANPFDNVAILETSVLSISGVSFTFNEAGVYRAVSMSIWDDLDVNTRFYNNTAASSAFSLPGYIIDDDYFRVSAGDVLTLQVSNGFDGAGSYTMYNESFIYLYKIEIN